MVVDGWTGEAVVVECFMPGGGRVGFVCSRVRAASFPCDGRSGQAQAAGGLVRDWQRWMVDGRREDGWLLVVGEAIPCDRCRKSWWENGSMLTRDVYSLRDGKLAEDGDVGREGKLPPTTSACESLLQTGGGGAWGVSLVSER